MKRISLWQLKECAARGVFWGMAFVVVFVLLQSEYAYFFYYMEQLQMFSFSVSSLRDALSECGGLAFWLSAFLYQFFLLPYMGAALTALTLVGSCWLLQQILKRLLPVAGSYLLSAIPALLLLPACVDMDFNGQGIVGYLLMLVFLLGYVSWSKPVVRFLFVLLAVPLLFWLAGPIALMLAVSVFFWSLVQGDKDVSWGWLVLVEYAAWALLFPYWAFLESWESALAPDFYYSGQEMNGTLYLFWWSIPVLLLVAWGCGQCKWRIGPGGKRLLWIGQGLLFCAGSFYLLKPQHPVLLQNMRQDYALRHEDWEGVLASFSTSAYNEQSLNLLNLALAKTGKWDCLFDYPQNGQSMIGIWDEQLPDAIAMNELFYHLGDVGMSQKLAYEGYIISRQGNPRLLQRLVETNLIFGEYQVAEKYLNLLEQTLFYKKWAQSRRHFLYDDGAVASDSVYGRKRRALGLDTNPAVSMDFGVVLERLAVNDPSDPLPLRYLTSYYLLNMDLISFMQLYEAYYGSEVWTSLTELQQEALVAWQESEPDSWTRMGVEAKILQRFRAFKDQIVRQSSYANLEKELSVSFGRTYWYYLMFRK